MAPTSIAKDKTGGSDNFIFHFKFEFKYSVHRFMGSLFADRKAIAKMIQLTDVFCALCKCINWPVIFNYNKRLIQLTMIPLSGRHLKVSV